MLIYQVILRVKCLGELIDEGALLTWVWTNHP